MDFDDLSLQDDDDGQVALFADRSKMGGDGKLNGRWGKAEHQRFVDGLKKYGKNWKKVEEHVRTRTGAQIRSHAQKFFNRLQKELNEGDDVPSGIMMAQEPGSGSRELELYDFINKGNELEHEVGLMEQRFGSLIKSLKMLPASHTVIADVDVKPEDFGGMSQNQEHWSNNLKRVHKLDTIFKRALTELSEIKQEVKQKLGNEADEGVSLGKRGSSKASLGAESQMQMKEPEIKKEASLTPNHVSSNPLDLGEKPLKQAQIKSDGGRVTTDKFTKNNLGNGQQIPKQMEERSRKSSDPNKPDEAIQIKNQPLGSTIHAHTESISAVPNVPRGSSDRGGMNSFAAMPNEANASSHEFKSKMETCFGERANNQFLHDQNNNNYSLNTGSATPNLAKPENTMHSSSLQQNMGQNDSFFNMSFMQNGSQNQGNPLMGMNFKPQNSGGFGQINPPDLMSLTNGLSSFMSNMGNQFNMGMGQTGGNPGNGNGMNMNPFGQSSDLNSMSFMDPNALSMSLMNPSLFSALNSSFGMNSYQNLLQVGNLNNLQHFSGMPGSFMSEGTKSPFNMAGGGNNFFGGAQNMSSMFPSFLMNEETPNFNQMGFMDSQMFQPDFKNGQGTLSERPEPTKDKAEFNKEESAGGNGPIEQTPMFVTGYHEDKKNQNENGEFHSVQCRDFYGGDSSLTKK